MASPVSKSKLQTEFRQLFKCEKKMSEATQVQVSDTTMPGHLQTPVTKNLL